jgi:hypothetical protein
MRRCVPSSITMKEKKFIYVWLVPRTPIFPQKYMIHSIKLRIWKCYVIYVSNGLILE